MKKIVLSAILALNVSMGVGLAQAPTDTLIQKLAERDTPQKRFLAAHPGTVDVRRLEDATHFRKVDGTFSAVFAPDLNYVDANNQLQPTAPELWRTSVGYREIGTGSTVRIIITANNQDTIEVWNGTQVATTTTSKLTKTGDWAWSFPWGLITWSLEITNDGWTVTSQKIAAARGAYTYQMPLASTGLQFTVGANGNLFNDTFTITRAVMDRADRQQTPCSAWSVGSKGVSFTCDDSAFPPEAFPYSIDPTLGPSAARATALEDCAYYATNSAGGPYNKYLCNAPLFAGAPWVVFDFGYGEWYRYNDGFFLSWNTSSIPTNAVVFSGTFSILSGGSAGDMSADSVSVYWYPYSRWPTQASYLTDSYGTLAGTKTGLSGGGVWNSWTLNQNMDQVAKGPGAITGFRGGPTFFSGATRYVDFYGPMNQNSSPSVNAPTLTLNYGIPGLKLIVVTND